MKTRLSALLSGAAIALVALLSCQQAAQGAVAVGQTASANARVDGLRVPSGTTLLSPAIVQAGVEPAILHLNHGRVVALAAQTVATVESVERGVRVAVRAGNLVYTGASGRVEVLSETESMVVTATGDIQEVPREGDEQEERLCELQDWTEELWQTCRHDEPNDRDCDWDLIRVPMSEVPQYLEITALLACEDRNDLGLECDCREEIVAAWWIPPAASAVAGGIVLSQILEDDDEPPASPSRP